VSAPALTPRRRRVWWKYLLVITGVGVVALLSGLYYLTTESFQNLVRRRMVAEVERITGGKAQVGSIHTIPFRMLVEVRDFTVHGREAPGDVPLAHADSLVARVKVISLLRTEFGFHEVSIERPVIHVVFFPDGSTNIPAPSVQRVSEKTPIEQIFGLSIDHFYVRRGELFWGDHQLPLELAVHDSDLQMDYSFLRSRYESRLLLGKVDTKFDDCRPFAWTASAEFSLATTFVDIKSLKVGSGRTHLVASGRVSDFRNPRVDATYDAAFDLNEAASIARQPELHEGLMELKGQGSWSLDQFTTSGALALRDFGWQNDQIVLKRASATSDYSVTDRDMRFTKLQGKVFGGSFAGDALVENWLHSVPPVKGDDVAVLTAARPTAKTQPSPKNQKPKAGVQMGTVHLKLHDISDEEIAAGLNLPAHPLGRFHPVGVGAATLEARWRGAPQNADVAFSFDFTAPPSVKAGELPITAHGQGTYRGAADQLELSQLNIATPASRIQAAGTLSDSSTLHLSMTTSDLDEWQPLIAALRAPSLHSHDSSGRSGLLSGSATLPFRVNGSATFNGVVGGKISAPTLAGTLTAEDFDVVAPATARTPEQDVHWDSLSASVQLSPHSAALHGGSLHRGDTSADFDVTVALQQWSLTDESSITARVNLHHVDVASTEALAGYNYPITGTADLSLEVSGTKADPQAQGKIHASDASAYGEPIAQFDADLNIENGETALANIRLLHDDATVTGSAAYNPDTQAYRVDVTGQNFDLAQVRQIRTRGLAVEGRGDFTLKGSGTVDAPNANGSIRLTALTLDHELSGGVNLDFSTKGRELQITGHSEFPHGTLALDGNVQLRDDYPARISVRMDQLDLDALWRSYSRGELTGHSAVAGEVTMQGPLRDPHRWKVDGNLSSVTLDVEYAKVHNEDPVRFSYGGETLHIDQLHLVGDGTDLKAHGSLSFAGTRDLDLTADGHMDLKLLNSIDPDLSASGVTSMNMTIAGTLSDPFPQGHIQLTNGAVTYAGLPSGLSEVNGSLSFTRDRFQIETLTARTGGGTLDLKGDATVLNNRLLNFDVTAVGKDVRLRYPPGVSSTANAELHWSGTRAASTVTGEIMVNKLAVTPNFDFSSYLERSRQISSLTPATSPLYNVKLDIHVQTAPELEMKTAVARLSGDADLHLRGSAARPIVLGRADILEGEATFNGTKYSLERGDITFANPVTIQPILNLEASTHVRNYDLAITVTGTPDQPGGLRVNYRSEPPLPQSDIIALLALGRTGEESEQLQQQSGQTPFTDEATALIINQAINSTVSSRMQRIFGVSSIKIDPQGLATETNPTARGPQVTIEQQFANNVSLTYSTNVSQSSQQIIQGEYYFTRNVSAVGLRDQNGVVSFDVRIRRRKK
jgi:translocation and assembly module TamB